jgi:D-alanyl-D-alanine carboxypeptidase
VDLSSETDARTALCGWNQAVRTRRRSTLFRRRVDVLAVMIAASAVLLQCSDAPPPAAPTPPPSADRAPPSAAASPAATAPPPPATATVQPVTAAELGASWRPGCPVEPRRLRRIDVNHIGFDGQTHRSQLIVNEDLVPQVIAIFEQLYRLGYPIEKMRTVDHYPSADDELSMEDNNTSGFNCRGIPGSDQWSQHAYGLAIDLNPLLNPYIDSSGSFQPTNAAAYLDRNRTDPGLLHDGDPAVRVFTDRGWRWGGHWRTPIDYQHFERP